MLFACASACGIKIVSEIDAPGHNSALIQALPEVVGNDPLAAGSNALCAGRKSTYQALDTILGEVGDVFKSTPCLHIGADEVNKSAWTRENITLMPC